MDTLVRESKGKMEGHAQDAVQARFREAFARHFVIKRVPRSKMDDIHQHPLIDILLLRRRSAPRQDC